MNLHIEARYVHRGKPGEAFAVVPYTAGRHDLPKDTYPFSINAYLGPDYGYAMDYVDVEEGDMLRFGYAESLKLDERRSGSWRQEFKFGDYIELRFHVEE